MADIFVQALLFLGAVICGLRVFYDFGRELRAWERRTRG